MAKQHAEDGHGAEETDMIDHPTSSPVDGERVSDERLAAIVAGQIYGADAILLMARELQQFRAASSPAGDAPSGYLIKPHGLNEEHWYLSSDPVDFLDGESVSLFPRDAKKPISVTPEWCMRMAELEGDTEIGAGIPDVIDDARAMVLSPDKWPPMRVKRVALTLLNKLSPAGRDEVIEECARVADSEAAKVNGENADRYWQSKRIAGAIRALKGQP